MRVCLFGTFAARLLVEQRVVPLTVLLVRWAVAFSMMAAPATAAGVRPLQDSFEGQVLNYEARIQAYVTLRHSVESGRQDLSAEKGLSGRRAARRSLATSIRKLRSGAKQGDILTPAIGHRFRELLKPEIDLEGISEELTEERPALALKVNGDYPESQPVTSVPLTVLKALPRLPEGEDLEYRFVGRHLILLDARANLIVDFLLNALP